MQQHDHQRTRDAVFIVRPVNDRVTVLCLSGTLAIPTAADLTASLNYCGFQGGVGGVRVRPVVVSQPSIR
ncbi:hypothetical protein [Streptomyces sp. 2231.1]|uniref:hypothetical protein n=1 Tax=Streptomyces sp. 2231.1 TaxID=1855347 RepID=UPI000B8A2381